ncbi:hypothetical protein H634G_11228 [Metarhizium anisopliae BRIP 53293]|uniref:Uncharacterized protein n=1 Tax=Metarhizium anisopliae BRIP 53293 TaxID=1291518 RepID=A0A0D9NHQ7_METAN|nr:hypothetical protein H634G_11228 [Metarhizium anisopliae BRIP 53293]
MVLPCIHTEILGSGSCETDEAATSDCPTGVDKLRETMRSLEQDRRSMLLKSSVNDRQHERD